MIADQFRTTFAALETAFDARFQQLFGGGFARLSLTDPTDLGATGVEIVARPPGKKAQALAMLSGGERALTAVALLFAMLEVRPVPFCVLDEVDAALDEANVGRFADALRSLADQTQFIVITHNRGTIEAADALYGVTVGDDSVSRVISLRLDEAQALADRQQAANSPASPLMPLWRAAAGDERGGAPRSRRDAGESRGRRAGREPDPPTRMTRSPARPRADDPADRRARRRRRLEPAPRRRAPSPTPDARARSPEPRLEPIVADSESTIERRSTPGSSGPAAGSWPGCAASSAPATEGPSWDDVEETLIAGDVGAALAMDVVERARRRRDPDGAEAAVRAELAALLVAARPRLGAATVGRGRPGGHPHRRRQRHRQDDDDRQAREPLHGRGPARSSSPPPTRSGRPRSTSSVIWADRAGVPGRRPRARRRSRGGRLRRARRGRRPRRRPRHRRHGRPPPHEVEPHGRAHEDPPDHRQAPARRRARRRSSSSTRRPARTGSPRRRRSTRRSG